MRLDIKIGPNGEEIFVMSDPNNRPKVVVNGERPGMDEQDVREGAEASREAGTSRLEPGRPHGGNRKRGKRPKA